jgi:hypothetical protein
MAINKAGVELLKADLRANAAAYKQFTFGRKTECGTEQCMAGFCHLRKVGQVEFSAEVRVDESEKNGYLEYACLESGMWQLGIEQPDSCPQIFNSHACWPLDLNKAYIRAKTDDSLVEVACAALDRLQDDGSIAEVEL